MYEEFINLQIRRSTDRGQTYDPAVNGLLDAGNNALFIAPFEMDPNDSANLVAGGRSIWRTTDAATNWGPIRGPTGNGNLCSSVTVAVGNSGRVWAGYTDGEIGLSRNNFANWDRVDTGILPNTFVTDIKPHPTDPNQVYVTFGGFGLVNVWRGQVVAGPGGTNAVNWTAITGNAPNALPQIPVYTITCHPRNTNWLYIGTDLGVFASEDGGQNWAVTPSTNQGQNGAEGPANVTVMDLFWLLTAPDIPLPDQLIAVTHGRGMFRTVPLDTVYVDLANTSGTENGTPEFPFNTVNEGFDAAGNGSRMIIRTGSYDETLLVTKRIRNISAENGTVIIGE